MSKRKLATTSLQISEKERAVFRILLGSVEHFQLGTCVRIAGGWVRDKAPRSVASVAVTAAEVLGRSSDDLDVAVDNMSGEQFANKVHESLRLAVSTAYMERVNRPCFQHLKANCTSLELTCIASPTEVRGEPGGRGVLRGRGAGQPGAVEAPRHRVLHRPPVGLLIWLQYRAFVRFFQR